MTGVFNFMVFFSTQNVNAGQISHTNSNLQLRYLSDYGRIVQTINWNGIQTVRDPMGFGFTGLVIDHSGYDHTLGLEDIADSYNTSFPYAKADDLKPVRAITLSDDGTTQKSIASIRNEGTIDPYDILIDQTAWTINGKDWAIIQWDVSNIKSPVADITNFNLGYEIAFSQSGSRYGVGGEIADGGDDIDGYDGTYDTYWVRDSDSGVVMGVASAITSDPINHFYGEDLHVSYDTYKTLFGDDTWLYNRQQAGNALATDGVTPGNVTTTVGWNGETILAGESRTFTLVIAMNYTHNDMIAAIQDAQDYYHRILTGFIITEIKDSEGSPAQIEVHNFGRPPTDPGGILALKADGSLLSGSWSANPIQTNKYSVFTANEPINLEGATIGLYENGILVDEVFFGTKGPVPDPLDSESVARYYDPNSAIYTDSWSRNSSSGPTMGSQNDIQLEDPDPDIVLNEVMFNPSTPDGGYVILMNKNPVQSINISGYRIVGDSQYQIPIDSNLWLDPRSQLIIGYPDDPPETSDLFSGMNPTADNVYLYDSSGILLDMMGWSSQHNMGMSARRVPDGTGTSHGYNDVTSGAAGWVFDSPLYVQITEISDSGSVIPQIEIYNPIYPKIDFSVGFSLSSATRGSLSGSWSTSIAQAKGYSVFDVTTPSGLHAQGDSISITQNNDLIETVTYGQKGPVPDPIGGESVQRVLYSGEYTEWWSRNLTTGTNFGGENDVPLPDFNTALRLNEVLFNPTSPNQKFVELFLLFSTMNISGYRIVANKEYIVEQGTILDIDTPNYYLDYTKDPQFFNTLDPQGDNVYLYDDNGVLLDMVGYSSEHIQGRSMCRVPNGNGTGNGFDDASSILAGWKFDCIPTIQLIKVTSNDDTLYGNFSSYIDFTLTVENRQITGDTISILNSTSNGYPVIIMNEGKTMEISEIFVPSGSSVNINVRIILPYSVPFVEYDHISITVQSQMNALYRDEVIIKAIVSPFIWPKKYAQPQDIYISGSGFGEISTITLNLTGMGSALDLKQPQEVIFCVDTSGSMTPEAIGLIKVGLIGYVDKMEKPDRGAVVFFNSGAWLMNRLTDNYTQLRNDIENIPGPGGSTYMGEALQVANNELIDNGNSSFIQVIILLTDGNWNGLINPVDEAIRAADNNITIFTIGLEPDPTQPPLDEALLTQIADITGGQYFYADDPARIPEIYLIIASYIGNLAGRDVDITDSTPMVRDVLPPWIVLVPGSFSIIPETNFVNESGYRILEWNISQISIGESWEVSFSVKSTRLGWVYANDVDSSRVYYVDYFNKEIFRLFPECLLNVSTPPPQPPILYIDILPNHNDIVLYWEKPQTPATDHYLLYRSPTSIGFDFSNPWKDTSVDLDPLDTNQVALGNRLSWNHTGGADLDDTEYSEQWYYCIRTVNSVGEISQTSRTVGKWTKVFGHQITTFSIPLKPILPEDTEYYCNEMNADYIKWMDPTNHTWITHYKGEAGENTLIDIGKGYEIGFAQNSTKYTFLGMPGSMIRYSSGTYKGFDFLTEAASLSASVLSGNDVTLQWKRPDAMDVDDIYKIYRAHSRDGLHDGSAILVTTIPYGTESFTDGGVALPGTQYYYIIVPQNELGEEGASTYSIGVFSAGYLGEYDTIGLPLATGGSIAASGYCSQSNEIVGINYFIESGERWGWHSRRMPEGAYDPMILMMEGYQISTSGPAKLIFIGR